MRSGSSSAKSRARLARQRAYREGIIEAAEELIAERGIEATKMEDIASATGISLRTTYSVIGGGKANLVNEIWRSRLSDLSEIATYALATLETPPAKLRAAFYNATKYYLSHPSFLRMQLRDGHSWGIRSAVASHTAVGTAFHDDGVGSIEAIIEEGCGQGDFSIDQASLTAYSIVALQQVHLAAWLAKGSAEDIEAVFDRFWTDAARLLGRSALPSRQED